jgi:MFS transporter, DHA1 family, multidrug resistance protein
MLDLVKDSAFGSIARALSHSQAFSYPEDQPDWKAPQSWSSQTDVEKGEKSELTISPTRTNGTRRPTSRHNNAVDDPDATEDLVLHPFTSRTYSIASVSTHKSTVKRQSTLDGGGSVDPGRIPVEWYSDDDPENPHCWSSSKKAFVSAQICIYTFSVYIGSSLYVAGEGDIQDKFHVGETASELGLALYVFAYGVGPMLWSPLSEIPIVGRNTLYIATYAIFIALSLGAALVKTFAGVLILRFLLGFFG